MNLDEMIDMLGVNNKKCFENCRGQCKVCENEKCHCDGVIVLSFLKELKQYREIGTVEGFRNAKEKQVAMKITETHVDEYVCPACGAEHLCYHGETDDNYCSECGHAIYQEWRM